MTRIIEHRQDALPGEELLELRVWQLSVGDVRGCIIPVDLPLNQVMLLEMSDPVDDAFLDALAHCEKEGIATLWIHDPFGLFPASQRPVREMP